MGLSSSKQSSNQKSDSVQNSQQVAASTQSSSNQAYPAIATELTPVVSQADKSSNAIADLLGLNGTTTQDDGFANYKKSSGYDFLNQQGIDAVGQSQAAKGLLNSGSTVQKLSDYSNNNANTFLTSYLDHLNKLANTGISAAGVVSGAGQTSSGQSNSSGTSSGVSASTGTSKGSSMSFTTG